MVACNPEDRPTIKEILEHKWFEEINNDNIKNILNEKVKEEFRRIYDQMGTETSKQIEIAKRVISENYNTRAWKQSDNRFNSNLKLNYISEDRINVNLSFVIKGYLNESKFMSKLIDGIEKKYKADCQIEPSSEEFFIMFNIDDDFSMKIQLFKYEKEDDKYLVEFVRESGSIFDYFDYFFEIKEIIKNLDI